MFELPMLAATLLMTMVAVVWFICAIVLVLVILIQKGRGGGLSSAFGGMASGVLGSKTGDFLTWVTVTLVCAFLFLSVVIAKYYKPSISRVDTIPAAQQTMPQQPQPSQEVPQSQPQPEPGLAGEPEP